eukprot:scpid86788/ scgid24038/ 
MLDLTSHLNWYDLYRHKYGEGLAVESSRYGSAMVDGELKEYKRGFTMEEYTPWLEGHYRHTQASPSLANFPTDYFNREDVRKALHIPTSFGGWESCSSTLNYTPQT